MQARKTCISALLLCTILAESKENGNLRRDITGGSVPALAASVRQDRITKLLTWTGQSRALGVDDGRQSSEKHKLLSHRPGLRNPTTLQCDVNKPNSRPASQSSTRSSVNQEINSVDDPSPRNLECAPGVSGWCLGLQERRQMDICPT